MSLIARLRNVQEAQEQDPAVAAALSACGGSLPLVLEALDGLSGETINHEVAPNLCPALTITSACHYIGVTVGSEDVAKYIVAGHVALTTGAKVDMKHPTMVEYQKQALTKAVIKTASLPQSTDWEGIARKAVEYGAYAYEVLARTRRGRLIGLMVHELAAHTGATSDVANDAAKALGPAK